MSFTEVGAFGNVRKLSAFLHNGEMVACGTESPDGALLPDLEGMRMAAIGYVSKKRQQLPQRMKSFAIQTLNIPQAFVEQGTLYFFFILLFLSVSVCMSVCLCLSLSVSVSLDFLVS